MAPYPGGAADVTTYRFDPPSGGLAEICSEELSDAFNYLPLEMGQPLPRDAAGNLVFYVQATESSKYTLQLATDLNVDLWSVSFDSDIDEPIQLNESDTANIQFCFHLKAGEYYAFRGVGFASATITNTPAIPLTLDKDQACTPDRSALYCFTAPAAGRYMTKAAATGVDDLGWADFLNLNNTVVGDSA